MKSDELKKNNGKDGKPTYIAYKGKIYDVTESNLWKNGSHMNQHKAGKDLTDYLSVAPHGEEVFNRFKEVGLLELSEKKEAPSMFNKENLRHFYRKYHPHPVLIHFPIALFLFAFIMQFLFLITKNKSFETASFSSMVFGELGAFAAIAAGIFSWWLNYDMKFTSIFKYKLSFSIILSILGLIAITLRVLFPDISFGGNFLSIIYYFIIFINVPNVLIVAYKGGKLTWPD